MEKMNPKEIKTHGTFSTLFSIDEVLLKKIEEDMRESTYDFSQPIILATWKGQEDPVCIDGHTRVQAAIRADIEQIPVWTHELDSEDEALEKSILLQRNRRSITDAEIYACMVALDKRMPRGGDRRSDEAKSKPRSCGNESSRSLSARKMAEKIGISTRKAEQMRTVMDHGDEQTIEAVKNGQMSTNKAYGETQKRRKKDKAVANTNQPHTAKRKRDKSRMVEIDPDQWEQLTKVAEITNSEIKDCVYEALEIYLQADDSDHE